ncbi:MAG: membrane lipoprotein lipid attachment site-containing protein, partial [Bacteroidales bacterium]|nr:membrane lipoprotein lipid attachment site-containing protein [Bacteroidales bacterium]
MKKILSYLSFLLVLASCNQGKQNGPDMLEPLFPEPTVVLLNLTEGYSINPVTGDSIFPIKDGKDQPIETGVQIPITGITIDAEDNYPPYIVEAGETKMIKAYKDSYEVPNTLKGSPVNRDSVITITVQQPSDQTLEMNSGGPAIIKTSST